jgi:hypothetical protein
LLSHNNNINNNNNLTWSSPIPLNSDADSPIWYVGLHPLEGLSRCFIIKLKKNHISYYFKIKLTSNDVSHHVDIVTLL